MSSLALLLLLGAFKVTASPRLLQAPPFQAPVRITAKIEGPVVEAEYCAGIEIQIGQGVDAIRSTHTQDCPAWDEYQRQLAEYATCKDKVIVCPPGYDVCEFNCAEPFDLRTEWQWDSSVYRMQFGPGHHEIRITFWLPNGKKQVRDAVFTVVGEDQ